MKLVTCFLVCVMLLVPLQTASAERVEFTVITLTALQVDSADDIEAAIISATAQGTQPGTVILNGRHGPFVFSGDDRSLNIFVSDLTLRGVNGAVIENCADGLFFDDFPLQHILVEEIAFYCTAGGVVASGAFHDVVLRDNLFQAEAHGIATAGASSGWLITGNLIQTGGDAIRMEGAEDVLIANNHLSGTIGVALFQCAYSEVQRNAIQATWQGVLLGKEAWSNKVQFNTILGVNASGIALEPGVVGNLIVANRVICAPGASCLTVDASPEVAEYNTIAGNKP